MRKLSLVPYALIPLLSVAGCSEVGKLALTDLNYAAKVATQGGDSAGAACWTALTPTASAIEGAPTPGLASIIEADRLFELATQGPTAACNAVAGMIMSEVLRKAVPFLP